MVGMTKLAPSLIPDGQRLVTLPHPTVRGGIHLRLEEVERHDDGALWLGYAGA